MKQCRRCHEVKPLDEFYPHKKMADGRLNHCRTCETERAKGRQLRVRSRTAPVSTGWTFDAIPTMRRPELLRWAASRYGLIDPSPDDVLMARWPLYDKGDRIHVGGYHRDFSEAIRMAIANVRVRFCKVCSTDISGLNGNRRYCGPRCQEEANTGRERGPTRSASRPMTDPERYRIVELYECGMTLLAMSVETGRSYSAIQRVLDEMGVERKKKRNRMSTLDMGSAA